MGVDRALSAAVFFDRDGVLNEAYVRRGKPHPPQSLDELQVFDSACEAVRSVREAGYRAIVVTNQPDVARGAQTRQVADALNEAVATATGADAVYTCFHDDADDCDCRKPKPGLVLRAAREQGIALAESYLIGDRQKDVACGRAAGCMTIFLDRGYAETPPVVGADHTVSSIGEAVRWILSRKGPQT